MCDYHLYTDLLVNTQGITSRKSLFLVSLFLHLKNTTPVSCVRHVQHIFSRYFVTYIRVLHHKVILQFSKVGVSPVSAMLVIGLHRYPITDTDNQNIKTIPIPIIFLSSISNRYRLYRYRYWIYLLRYIGIGSYP